MVSAKALAFSAIATMGGLLAANAAPLLQIRDTPVAGGVCNTGTDNVACGDQTTLLICNWGTWQLLSSCSAGTVCQNGGCVFGSPTSAQATTSTSASSTTSTTSATSTKPSTTTTTTSTTITTRTTSSTPSSTSTPGGGSNFGITCDSLSQAVVSGGASLGLSYPVPSSAQCTAFLNGMIPAGAIASAREAAMFLANILWESDGLRAKEEYQCKNNPSACVGQYTTPQDVPGQTYWGRGYIQLTWHYNYLAASMALYGDDRLATNAAQVATNEDIAWAVSFWYWKAEVRTDPGVMAGQFGSAVNRINGALECSGPNQDLARKRYQIYKAVLAVFSPGETPIETGCYN